MSDLQLFDALPPHIEAALRASIERFGVLVPVVVDQNGRVLDGHHRGRIAAELGAEGAPCRPRQVGRPQTRGAYPMQTTSNRHDQPPAVDVALDDAADGVHDAAAAVAAMVPHLQALIRLGRVAQGGHREAMTGIRRARECAPRRRRASRPEMPAAA